MFLPRTCVIKNVTTVNDTVLYVHNFYYVLGSYSRSIQILMYVCHRQRGLDYVALEEYAMRRRAAFDAWASEGKVGSDMKMVAQGEI